MLGKYIEIPDSIDSLFNRCMYDTNTREAWLINKDGKVVKLIPSSNENPGIKDLMDKYAVADAKDNEIIAALEKKGVKHLSKPITKEEIEYKKAISRINSRKFYLREKIQKELEFCNSQSENMEPVKSNAPVQPELNLSQDENHHLLDWWNCQFGSNYFKITRGFLGYLPNTNPQIQGGEFLLPIEEIRKNDQMKYYKFKGKLSSFKSLATHLSITDRSNRLTDTQFNALLQSIPQVVIEIIPSK